MRRKSCHFIWGIWWFHKSKDFEAVKAGKLAIRPWLVCQYNEHTLVDLPSSVGATNQDMLLFVTLWYPSNWRFSWNFAILETLTYVLLRRMRFRMIHALFVESEFLKDFCVFFKEIAISLFRNIFILFTISSKNIWLSIKSISNLLYLWHLVQKYVSPNSSSQTHYVIMVLNLISVLG